MMALPTISGLKQVNLDQLLEDFSSWQKHANELWKQKEERETQIELMKRELTEYKEQELKLGQDVEQMKTLVNDAQKTLSRIYNYEDENRQLTNNIQSLKDSAANEMKLHESSLLDLNKKIENMKDCHHEHLEEQKETLQNQAILERDLLRTTIDDKTEQIEQLIKHSSDLEAEKQAEIMKLRLEYDSKLLKLQKQTAKTQQTTTQMSAANQDIFRKKLQHVKAETEREVAQLNRTIHELQQNLSVQQPKRSTTSNAGPGGKKRRF